MKDKYARERLNRWTESTLDRMIAIEARIGGDLSMKKGLAEKVGWLETVVGEEPSGRYPAPAPLIDRVALIERNQRLLLEHLGVEVTTEPERVVVKKAPVRGAAKGKRTQE